MATALTVTAKGQVTLKKRVLEHLWVKPGDQVEVTLLADGRVELRHEGERSSLADLRGALKRPRRRPVTLDEMQAAIEAGRGG